MHFLLCVQQQPEKFTYVASCEIILLPWYSLFAPDPGLTLFLEAIGSPGESKPSDILVISDVLYVNYEILWIVLETIPHSANTYLVPMGQGLALWETTVDQRQKSRTHISKARGLHIL